MSFPVGILIRIMVIFIFDSSAETPNCKKSFLDHLKKSLVSILCQLTETFKPAYDRGSGNRELLLAVLKNRLT